MRLFLGNILLTFVWLLLTGTISARNFFFGYVICYFILWVVFRKSEHHSYFKKFPAMAVLLVYFFKQVVFSNFRIAYDLLTLGNRMHPGIVKVPIEFETTIQFLILSNLITLTPGTLVLDYDEENKELYVHMLYSDDAKKAIKGIKILEGKIKRAVK